MHTKKINLHAKNKFSKNVCLRKKFDLMLIKLQKFLGPNFQNYLKNYLCRHQKNASHTVSIYRNCMISIFFKKGKPRLFLWPDRFITINSYRNKFISFFNHFWKLYENCMTSIFPHTWCMKLYDKHFRCMEVIPGCLSPAVLRLNSKFCFHMTKCKNGVLQDARNMIFAKKILNCKKHAVFLI